MTSITCNSKSIGIRLKQYFNEAKPFLMYCSFSFLFSFDPSEPFLVDYFTNVLGIDPEIVYQDIFPYWTYSYFAFLFIFGILGEFIGYKTIIIIGMVSKILTIAVLLTTNKLVYLILEQVTDGLSYAAYIVFLAYIYFSLDPNEYQKMSCRVNAGYLVGVVSSGLLGQLLVQKLPLVSLLSISCGTNILALILALTFTNHKSQQKFSIKETFTDLINTYKNTDILRWYIWSGIAISIHQIVLTYWQSLFLQINNDQNWNGYISASAYFFASFFAIIPSKLGNSINNIQNLVLVVFGLLGGALLMVMGFGLNLVISTFSLIIYNCCFEFMSPIVNVQIAKKLSSRIGLLFSFNIMIALTIQVLVQLTVGKQFLNLDIKSQFLYYGGCLFVLSFGFSVLFGFLFLKKKFFTKSNSVNDQTINYISINQDDDQEQQQQRENIDDDNLQDEIYLYKDSRSIERDERKPLILNQNEIHNKV
ncbi:hypothetical protein CYY_005025 [Polysphondylium violaceum]|uniref:Reduced folate carrier family protein n=1 Tax=Polysphondylium violaceum TaxID=133409 RepID=A0A8J4PU81_9MYCE|nr:hypothetical protein CYY_005025 [Polysphondylium violaceum]